ncbi:peptidase domain-containing ABC transporter [Vulcanococcus limneticus]|uniref:peptidase domain-containing ABC transporter n=1 Tax=Vulcanococcus limneticus TaxID=2170428 RepID=UPI000B984CC2|nr:peptidase domain-containing ABC transporter [Vulcanococcus limneticus]MCP9792840.1 peptidase domain-containing ABC transporter [Vulcanococcus limneticus MW73D5]MCP9894832.1 peptidase domain-containing ABC transporter [Vulcanococcus limneticus Candia 3F8]MCP9898311.1 peptidase domain-containing ABC transporter [Vulcanococcus limneticus Candia 3B3]
MTTSPNPSLAVLGHPAFADLSEAARGQLAEGMVYLRFRPGQILCQEQLIPSKVLLILQGNARLLGSDRGKLVTLAKLGPGHLVGLVSLLRALPCEEVSASSELVAAAIPDALLLKLFEQEDGFRGWCGSTLFPAELAALLKELLQRTHRSDVSLADALAAAAKRGAALVAAEPAAIEQAAEAGLLVHVASGISGSWSLGDRLEPHQTLPREPSPLPLRLIGLPASLIDQLERQPETGTATSNNGDAIGQGHATAAGQQPSAPTIQDAPELPARSALPIAQAHGRSLGASKALLVRAERPFEVTLACFQMISRLMGLPYRRDAIEKVLQDAERRGHSPSLQLCGQLASNLGLHVMSSQVPLLLANRLQTPALVSWGKAFALITESSEAGLTLASPADGWVTLSPRQVAERFPDGLQLLLFDRMVSTPEARFGPAWFWPAIKQYRGVLLQVLAASFVVQLFTLANPLLIQVIIDKVISQRSLDTLQVLGIALVVVSLLEGVLGSLRTFLFAETTNRIDLRLGAEVIDHLLRLPLGYFDRRPVGELSSRIAELEKIRNFLTGQALTTVLDAAFSVIYILVMALYSWVLTIVALLVVPIQVFITFVGAPLFRRQFRQAAEANASTQSHLVEVLSGIQTVKAQNVEMVSRWTWQERYSRYMALTFQKTITGTAVNETSQWLQKVSQLLVLWVGAVLVLQGQLTLGQLIAFRIISGYVTQPLLRLTTIWQNVQELRVSFERLADVVDTPQESNEADQQKIPLPPVQGKVRFEDLSFSFAPGSPAILRNINLTVPAGTFVGVVGQSGSGKSTLMKLLPRLYSPQEGRILIDSYDIDKVELYSLRRQIGIVPQDPLLFSGTINENIALTDPEASSEAIVAAARIAAAHDFIMELPSGYSTPVGERGAGLSGGQRQRIAIARTLLSNPKLLVMDEATSALDYDTERQVCENLRSSLKGCTVFFITHRLSTIRNADLIVMMDRGSIVETGSHDELMARRGRYFALYRQQESIS